MTRIKESYPPQHRNDVYDVFPVGDMNDLEFIVGAIPIKELLDSIPQESDEGFIAHYEQNGGTFSQLVAHRAYVSSRNQLDAFAVSSGFFDRSYLPDNVVIKRSLLDAHERVKDLDEYKFLQEEYCLRRQELLDLLRPSRG